MDNKLKQLEETTNNIINNLNKVFNSAKTSELNALVDSINKNLEQQSKLVKETSAERKSKQTNQIQTVNRKLKEQNRLLNDAQIKRETATNFEKLVGGNVNNTSSRLPGPENTPQSSSTSGLKTYQDPMLAGSNKDAATLFAIKNRGTLLRMGGKAADFIGSFFGPIGKIIGGGIEMGAELTAQILEQIEKIVSEIIDTVNQFGDKFEEIVSKNDDAVKKSLQDMGLLSTHMYGDKRKADTIANNILNSGAYLVQTVNIAFGPEKIAEFQQAYSELSKTSIGFSDADYVVIAAMGETLNLSSQDMSSMVFNFNKLGGSVEKTSKFYTAMVDSATKSGIATQTVIRDVDKFYDATKTFRFRGAMTDLTDMLAYAKRIKVDIVGMFDLMDSVNEPESAINLAAQLQALDTSFLGIDPIDFMTAAMTDVKKFTSMIMDPIRNNIDNFFDRETGQVTQRGRFLVKNLFETEGISKVFKDKQAITEALMSAAKEKTAAELLSESGIFQAFDKTKQDQIIAVMGKELQGTRGTTIPKDIRQYTQGDFDALLKSGLTSTSGRKDIETAAGGTTSAQKQIDVNKLLVDSMMMNVEAINTARKMLSDDTFRDTLMRVAGNTILSVGLETFRDDTLRSLEVMKDYLGLSTSEALMFQSTMIDSINNSTNLFGSAMVGMMRGLHKLDIIGVMDIKESDVDAAKYTSQKGKMNSGLMTNIFKRSDGGVVTGRSVNIPKRSLQPMPATGGSLASLLSNFRTNKFGSGILTGGGGTTKIIVSGEIRNKINDKDAGAISGEKVLAILEKHMS